MLDVLKTSFGLTGFLLQTKQSHSAYIPIGEKLWKKNSNKVLKGAGRAPHRSLFYAMGYTPEDLERPLIGVVNSQNEIVPGHFHLDTITKRSQKRYFERRRNAHRIPRQ